MIKKLAIMCLALAAVIMARSATIENGGVPANATLDNFTLAGNKVVLSLKNSYISGTLYPVLVSGPDNISAGFANQSLTNVTSACGYLNGTLYIAKKDNANELIALKLRENDTSLQAVSNINNYKTVTCDMDLRESKIYTHGVSETNMYAFTQNETGYTLNRLVVGENSVTRGAGTSCNTMSGMPVDVCYNGNEMYVLAPSSSLGGKNGLFKFDLSGTEITGSEVAVVGEWFNDKYNISSIAYLDGRIWTAMNRSFICSYKIDSNQLNSECINFNGGKCTAVTSRDNMLYLVCDYYVYAADSSSINFIQYEPVGQNLSVDMPFKAQKLISTLKGIYGISTNRFCRIIE